MMKEFVTSQEAEDYAFDCLNKDGKARAVCYVSKSVFGKSFYFVCKIPTFNLMQDDVKVELITIVQKLEN